MKSRLLIWWLNAILLLLGAAGCHKYDAPPLPPDIPETEQPNDGIITIEAKDADEATFLKHLNQTVRLHGHTTPLANRTTYIFKDGFRVELYIDKHKLANFSPTTKEKLNRVGQELTVLGKFIIFTTANGFQKKQIEYFREEDLAFDNSPPPQRSPAESLPLIETAKTSMSSVFVAGKEVRLRGVITHTRILGVKNFTPRPFMTFKDGKEIQIYNENHHSFPQDIQDKLFKVGTELTVRGVFNEYYVPELLYNSADDITFHN